MNKNVLEIKVEVTAGFPIDCKLSFQKNAHLSRKIYGGLWYMMSTRTVERGVGRVGDPGPGPAKVLFNEKIVCPLGPGAMQYQEARTGSRWP